MSDFDKEAEREKLREKYGDDEDDRAATEQMSELLLKGATMTNAHCNDCGDPIFRFDGQEFCPTCQKPVDRGDGATDEAGEQAEQSGSDIEVTTPEEDATVQFGGDTPARDNQAQADGERTDPIGESTRTPESTGDTDKPTAERDPQPRRAPSVDPAPTETPNSDGHATAPPTADAGHTPAQSSADTGRSSASAHLTNAQVLLAQTVEQYAQRARDTESPREATEYLEAAREAAETLAETGLQ